MLPDRLAPCCEETAAHLEAEATASPVVLVSDGVEYTLTVEPSEFLDGGVHIALTTTRPPLGLHPTLYEFHGRLGTPEQERHVAAAQRVGIDAPLDAHDARRG